MGLGLTICSVGTTHVHMSKQWSADEAVDFLLSEKAYDGIDLTATDQSSTNDVVKRLLREAAPVAAMSLVHLAKYSTNERMRYMASTWILERNLGKIGETPTVTEKDPYMQLLEDAIKTQGSA